MTLWPPSGDAAHVPFALDNLTRIGVLKLLPNEWPTAAATVFPCNCVSHVDRP